MQGEVIGYKCTHDEKEKYKGRLAYNLQILIQFEKFDSEWFFKDAKKEQPETDARN